jgi:hypothetical protein
MASFHNDQSFLRKAGTRKFFLDINNLPKIPKSISDRLYVIESKYENRPDLLAHDLFGSVQLWWVFALRNPDIIIDPLTDFTSGKKIYIPPRETIDRVL